MKGKRGRWISRCPVLRSGDGLEAVEGFLSGAVSVAVKLLLDFEHEARWVFEELFQADEEAHAFFAVDEAVVVA